MGQTTGTSPSAPACESQEGLWETFMLEEKEGLGGKGSASPEGRLGGYLSSHRKAVQNWGPRPVGLTPQGVLQLHAHRAWTPRGAESSLCSSPAQERGCQAL